MTRDEQLWRTIDDMVHELIAVQTPDGYLGPFSKDRRLTGRHFDVWSCYHLMLSLLRYYQIMGKAALLVTFKKHYFDVFLFRRNWLWRWHSPLRMPSRQMSTLADNKQLFFIQGQRCRPTPVYRGTRSTDPDPAVTVPALAIVVAKADQDRPILKGVFGRHAGNSPLINADQVGLPDQKNLFRLPPAVATVFAFASIYLIATHEHRNKRIPSCGQSQE